jgi:aspartyl-tRNA(Asn)/glutamyl-tRNA(Gln) amidotransferase subunit B
LQFEIERQTRALHAGDKIVQETRHFDEASGKTHSLRSKEEAFDYRYFPEPDLVPIEPDAAWIEQLRAALPELPRARRERLVAELGLDQQQAAFVGASADSVAYFEALLAEGVASRDAAVWMAGELARALNTHGHDITQSMISAQDIARLIEAVRDGVVNLNTAKKVFQDAYSQGKTPLMVIDEQGLRQVSDDAAIRAIVDEVLVANAAEVQRYRSGEEKVFGFLVGQVMRATKGQAAPPVVNAVLKAALNE